MKYDSLPDTLKHITRVQQLLSLITQSLIERAIMHDWSKTQEPEKSIFDLLTPEMRQLKWGSPEYRAIVPKLMVGINHHYKHNRHHPEYHAGGIMEMNLMDIMEMVVDWFAAAERTPTGNVYEILGRNSERFNINPQLVEIIKNTYQLFYE